MRFWILKEVFVSFVRTRGMSRHFRRLGFLDLVKGPRDAGYLPPSLVQTLVAAANSEPDKLLKELETHNDGLSETEAEYTRGRVGLNEIAQEKPPRWWVHLWYCYKNPFNLLLSVLAIMSYYTEDMMGSIVISSMVFISTLLRFFQESRSNKAADKLREMVSNTATVIRRDPSENAAEDALKYF